MRSKPWSLGGGIRRAVRCAALALALGLGARAAYAAPPTVAVPTDPEAIRDAHGEGVFGFLGGIRRNQFLLGDMWGLRTFLSRYGISLGLQETSEVLGNVTGGVKTGAAYDGLFQAVLQLDTSRAFGLYGGTFNASGLQIHGNNLSADNLLTLQTASGIEADRATRLWELWYQQKFLAEDRLDVKIGQQSLDQEFMVSQNALVFVSTMFGWPMLPSADMPGGGPAYPLSSLGVRVRARPINPLTVLVGVFNGRPMKHADAADSQADNPHGLDFSLSGHPLAIAELQYAYPSLGAMNYPGESQPMPRVYKLGVWYDGESFADQRFDDGGLSLASSASSGNPRQHRGNYAIYAVADQIFWQQEDELDRTASVFLRVMGTPLTDRNLIDFSLNAGVTIREPIRHRDDDTLALGVSWAHVSDRAAALDRDTAATGVFTPVRSSELLVEATYQYQVAPWWQLQPDLQWVIVPGGGLADPGTPGQRIKNEVVLGLRTNIAL